MARAAEMDYYGRGRPPPQSPPPSLTRPKGQSLRSRGERREERGKNRESRTSQRSEDVNINTPAQHNTTRQSVNQSISQSVSICISTSQHTVSCHGGSFSHTLAVPMPVGPHSLAHSLTASAASPDSSQDSYRMVNQCQCQCQCRRQSIWSVVVHVNESTVGTPAADKSCGRQQGRRNGKVGRGNQAGLNGPQARLSLLTYINMNQNGPALLS